MKGGHNKKSVRVEFVMSEPEAELVKERMAELGITNLSAYLRKMAVDGYIIHLDMGDIQEMMDVRPKYRIEDQEKLFGTYRRTIEDSLQLSTLLEQYAKQMSSLYLLVLSRVRNR